MTFRSWGMRGLAVLALLTAAVAIGACGSDDDSTTSAGNGGSSDEPFQVHVLTALSGPVATAGAATEQAMEVAADRINEEGGIGGREVVVETSDTGGVATNAVAAIKPELSGDDKPDLVFPANTSDETLALCPLLAQAQVLSVGVTADPEVGDPSICPYNFSVSLSADGQVRMIGEYMKEQGYERVGLLTATDAYGRAITSAAEEILPEMGLEVVAAEDFDPEAVSIIQQWGPLRDADPEVVFVEGQGPAIAKALDGRNQTNVDVPVIGGTGAAQANPGALVASPAALDDVTLMTYGVQVRGKAPFPERYDPAVKQFTAKNGGKYDVGMHVYTLAYDTLAAVQTAAAEAGATDPDSLRETLESFGENPPSDPTWLTHEEFGYSPDSHFPAEGAFAPAAGTEQKDGLLEPAKGQ